jgi:probable biosynthetic protein (TIGR04098 family)
MHALSPPILVGMPQLGRGGLSENWLLKECGHCHWMLLARRMGLAVPDFRDAGSDRLHAAFTAVRVEGAGLGAVREHDTIRIRSSLARISRTQFMSRHARPWASSRASSRASSVRGGDGQKIADVFTLRAPARALRVEAAAGGVRHTAAE